MEIRISACWRWPTARWARRFLRLTLSFLNRSLNNPPLRSTTRSFTRWRTKRNGSITISKSRETFNASCSPESPAIDGFQISGINVPARQVSGDYFDYIQVDQERLGVAIADVSGKGVPASLIMAICRSVLRAEAARNPSP